jgi:hypothetical protein
VDAIGVFGTEGRVLPDRMVKPSTALEEYKKSMTAPELLAQAATILQQRGDERDKSDGERTMAQITRVFNALLNRDLSEEEGWIFMIILKLVRAQAGKVQPDDFLDTIGYAALLAECAVKEK